MKTVKLGDIISLQYGKALKKGDRRGGSVAVVGSSGVVGFHDQALSSGPAIVIGRKGSIGSITWVPGGAWPIDTAYEAVPRGEGVDPRWLYWILGSLGLEGMNKSAAVPGLNRDDVYRLSILLPDVKEQKRIAAILDRADEQRSRRRAQIALLEELVNGEFSSRFGDIDVAERAAGSVWRSLRNGQSPDRGGNVVEPVLTLSSVTRGRFNPRAFKAGTFNISPGREKRVRGTDFLISRGNGNRELVGVGVFVGGRGVGTVFPDTVIAASLNLEVVDPLFFEVAWAQPSVRRQIEAAARTTNGTFKINQKALEGVALPFPPLDTQREFAALVEKIDVQRARVERALALEDELFASLQHRAFRGEL